MGDEVDGNVFVLFFEAADFVEGGVGDDGRAAGGVGADDDAFDVFVGIGGFEAVAQHGDLVLVAAADDAFEFDDGGVRFAFCAEDFFQAVAVVEAACGAAVEGEEGGGEKKRADAAPDVAPEAAAALFFVDAQEEFVEGVALPAFGGGLWLCGGLLRGVFVALFFFALDFEAHGVSYVWNGVFRRPTGAGGRGKIPIFGMRRKFAARCAPMCRRCRGGGGQ